MEECAVCLQPQQHPVVLPCGHQFCFLCIKGVAFRALRCALCRAHIPASFFDAPVLADRAALVTSATLGSQIFFSCIDIFND